MSAHLDSLPDLPKIRLRIVHPHPHPHPTPADPCTSGTSNVDRPIPNGNSDREQPEEEKENCSSDSECKTPKSAEFQIPAMLKCPPAPRKPKPRAAASCKRKLIIDLFEVVNEEEIDSFFRSGFQLAALAKRRRRPDLHLPTM